jgi:hypothetical protein
LRLGFLLILLALCCFALLPNAKAVVPAPDGGYANRNTAEGEDALFNLDTTQSSNNTAIGFNALWSDTIGVANTATGVFALYANTIGGENTATGAFALYANTTGVGNTANGDDSLRSNTTGSDNTASGTLALTSNTSGNRNTAVGYRALIGNRTGRGNTAVGAFAGATTKGDNNIDIGNRGIPDDSGIIRIGTTGTQTATYVAGISGVTVADGVMVVVDSNGQLGTLTSSARYKEAIQPMYKASEAIFALRPVTFRYKHELDPEGIPQFGLVAEQVEKVNPDLVARDAEDKPYTVRYEAVNAMLLNEFLKEHRTVQELKSTAAKQEATIAKQQKQIEALTTGLQKVSDQLELSKTAPQTVVNN